MRRENWEPKHTLNAVIVIAALAAIVLLSIYSDGSHVDAVVGFVSGLLVPGSPIPALFGGGQPRPPAPQRRPPDPPLTP